MASQAVEAIRRGVLSECTAPGDQAKIEDILAAYHDDPENNEEEEVGCFGGLFRMSGQSFAGNVNHLTSPASQKVQAGPVWRYPAPDGRSRTHSKAAHSRPCLDGEEGPLTDVMLQHRRRWHCSRELSIFPTFTTGFTKSFDLRIGCTRRRDPLQGRLRPLHTFSVCLVLNRERNSSPNAIADSKAFYSSLLYPSSFVWGIHDQRCSMHFLASRWVHKLGCSNRIGMKWRYEAKTSNLE